MAEEQTPVEALQEFRAILVAERQNIVRNALSLRKDNAELGNEIMPWDGANRGVEFQRVQEQIDAVDRAIADEERG